MCHHSSFAYSFHEAPSSMVRLALLKFNRQIRLASIKKTWFVGWGGGAEVGEPLPHLFKLIHTSTRSSRHLGKSRLGEAGRASGSTSLLFPLLGKWLLEYLLPWGKQCQPKNSLCCANYEFPLILFCTFLRNNEIHVSQSDTELLNYPIRLMLILD